MTSPPCSISLSLESRLSENEWKRGGMDGNVCSFFCFSFFGFRERKIVAVYVDVEICEL